MESQNKLFEAFKAAAAADEQTTFSAQDKLWGRIEQQLDKQEPKSIPLFSFAAIKYTAAALLLIAGIAVGWDQFFSGKSNEKDLAGGAKTVSPALAEAEQKVLSTDIGQERITAAVKPVQVKKPVIAVADPGYREMPADNGARATENMPPDYYFTLENFNQEPESFKDRLIEKPVFLSFEAQAVAQAPALEAITPADDFPEERLLKVQGVIVDKAGVALANARISVAGTERMVTSDAQGKFALAVPDTAEFIIVHSYGNETKYVKVGERMDKIEISPDRNNVALLNDISRYNRSSSMQNFYSFKTTSFRQELASKQKQQTMPHQAPSTDPLIIVNGAPYSGKFSDINSRHIKEVKILPEATARALYGERAKNGVIVITLKKGKPVPRQ